MWGGLLFSFFYYLIPIIMYKILAKQDYTFNHWYQYHFLESCQYHNYLKQSLFESDGMF